jgi:hypothetical protein
MQIIAWGLSGSVALLAIVAWGDSYQWAFANMGIYQIFPLFGLLAFSLMWSHYVVSAIRQYFKVESKALSDYFEITSAVVLTAILLHPGLLIWQLWRDGLGLPPGSAKVYVGAAAYWAIWFGVIAWTAFISYEFRRIFGTKKWWPIVQHASDVAMVLIFVHALRLGGALNSGWFRSIWYLYGVSFVVALTYGYIQRYRPSHKVAPKK